VRVSDRPKRKRKKHKSERSRGGSARTFSRRASILGSAATLSE